MKCERCSRPYTETPYAMCAIFGIPNPRLLETGFVLYDQNEDKDVAELDECREAACPGLSWAMEAAK